MNKFQGTRKIYMIDWRTSTELIEFFDMDNMDRWISRFQHYVALHNSVSFSLCEYV